MVKPINNKTHGKDYEEFGKKIAEARDKKGLNQKEASQQLGLPQSTYAGYETGTRKIPLSLIKQFSLFYGVSADHLLGNDEVDDSDDITLAASRTDGYDKDLPEEAIEEINKYIELLKLKYGKKGPDDQA